MTFATPDILFWLTVVVATAAIVLAVRAKLRKTTRPLLIAAVTLFSIGHLEPTIQWPRPLRVVAMIDLSPSTRGGAYREQLESRLRELMPDITPRRIYFSQAATNDPPATLAADLPAARTVFSPPADADAIVLFSDGHFELPNSSPPVYAVIDPALSNIGDARIVDVGQAGDRLNVTTENAGDSRRLLVNNTNAINVLA